MTFYTNSHDGGDYYGAQVTAENAPVTFLAEMDHSHADPIVYTRKDIEDALPKEVFKEPLREIGPFID